ncbi:tetratricopeptide repeat protein [Dapis sp. BLCC M172]|uniref:tetratricopeptide repeat protein n=1 Tax=Dapis sp. BLCC M172 TaxID=2975281 RepID=UPI003CFA6BE9
MQALKSRDKVEDIWQFLEYPSPKEIEEINKLDEKFINIKENFKENIKEQQIITRVKNYSQNSQEIHKNPYLRDWWWKDFYTQPLDILFNIPANIVTSVCIFCIVVISFRNLDIVSSFGFDLTEIFKISLSSIGVLVFSATFFGNIKKHSKNFLSLFGINPKWHDETVSLVSLCLLIFIAWLFIFNIPSMGRSALNKGDKLLKQGKYIQAESQYQKALTYLNPENSQEQNIIEKFTQYFSLSFTQEKHPLILFKLGQVYYQKLDLDKAQKYYQQAILLETNQNSVFYMDYLNNLAKIIILKSYDFPSISQVTSDSQSSSNKNTDSQSSNKGDKSDQGDKVDKTAKFLLDLSQSIYSNRTTELFCRKLKLIDQRKYECYNKKIFKEIENLLKYEVNISVYKSKYNDLDLYNYESEILNEEKGEKVFSQELEQQSKQVLEKLSEQKLEPDLEQQSEQQLEKLFGEKLEQELEQQLEQQLEKLFGEKLLELRLKYLKSIETLKFNYGLYELLFLKNIKDSKDIQNKPSFKNKLNLAKEHFKISSFNGAVPIIGRELNTDEVQGEFNEDELKFEDKAPDKVKEMKSLCFYRLSQFMEKTSSQKYIDKKNEMKKVQEAMKNAKKTEYPQKIDTAEKEMKEAEEAMKNAKEAMKNEKKEEYEAIMRTEEYCQKIDTAKKEKEEAKEAMKNAKKEEYEAIESPLKYLEKKMVGDRCYGKDLLPINTLDFYEQRIVYDFRRIPGFPQNPN